MLHRIRFGAQGKKIPDGGYFAGRLFGRNRGTKIVIVVPLLAAWIGCRPTMEVPRSIRLWTGATGREGDPGAVLPNSTPTAVVPTSATVEDVAIAPGIPKRKTGRRSSAKSTPPSKTRSFPYNRAELTPDALSLSTTTRNCCVPC